MVREGSLKISGCVTMCLKATYLRLSGSPDLLILEMAVKISVRRCFSIGRACNHIFTLEPPTVRECLWVMQSRVMASLSASAVGLSGAMVIPKRVVGDSFG